MRKVDGADITVNELKSCYFGFSTEADFNKTVDRIIIGGDCFMMTEDNDIVRFPVDFLDETSFPSFSKTPKDFEITVYDFIRNYWALDEFDLEDFDFYFVE